ncbi:hypothetical protein N7539_004896 [Penicillium diatomitis]|uniref:Uncharacterized protein n=1 Tax=Penicillium diatomitis TaxID=2819901 RepID=A0A9W9X5P3_9EURO|nr:uncharacterized protein N7539_004896 [Penicillium diatomitis]KAJ5484908.1 hypothetical protein N7539_004896 [Penicillium diatomitis]
MGTALQFQSLTPDTPGCGEASGKLRREVGSGGTGDGGECPESPDFAQHSESSGCLEQAGSAQLPGRDRFMM